MKSNDNRPQPDWNPTAPDVLRDQRAAYDAMRRRCPVAYSEFMGWSLFRHEDVMRVLLDHETFSSAVSQHLFTPSDMEQPEHTPCRRIIERYFASERMSADGRFSIFHRQSTLRTREPVLCNYFVVACRTQHNALQAQRHITLCFR